MSKYTKREGEKQFLVMSYYLFFGWEFFCLRVFIDEVSNLSSSSHSACMLSNSICVSVSDLHNNFSQNEVSEHSF